MTTAENIALLKNFLATTINTKYKDVPPTEEQFNDEATSLYNSMKSLYPVTEDDYKEMIKTLKSEMILVMDDGTYITDNSDGHQSWFIPNKGNLEFYYWPRYKTYLETQKGWAKTVTTKLDKTTDEIVDLLGDPNKSEFQRRGLVLGDVQSGKTANYTAICNKVADAGYKVIIILAGIQENLRVQTQERLDAEFAGRQSKYSLIVNKKKDTPKNVPVGVGRIPPVNPLKRITCFTSVSTDFNKNVVNGNDLSLHNIDGTALFVVKKNSRILNNLLDWLLSNNADTNNRITDMPLLVIDDEADNASINTKDQDDPTAINIAIRSILASFKQASYLGVTATPFANIFINPETVDGKPDDLFPRHFIYSVPAPPNYIGMDAIFGNGLEEDWENRSNAPYANAVETILNEEQESYFRFRHKQTIADDLLSLPPSLYEAMRYFLLVNGIRDQKTIDQNTHRSMLVNVSRFTKVQNKITDLVYYWLNSVVSDVRNYSKCSFADAMKIRSIQELFATWKKYDLGCFSKTSWPDFLKNQLLKSIAGIEVRTVNSSHNTEGLNYFAYKDTGLRVIAIGGNCLSRGLTLEGLTVSYFYRNTKMYDTLLQMGRWFGYRSNYEDLFKIWMGQDAVDWYGYITDATNELKREIDRMNSLNLTPNDFGLKVRQDPNSLIVTARNKMKSGSKVSIPVSVTGRLLETPRLSSDANILAQNERLCKNFIKSLDENGHDNDEHQNAYIWHRVPKEIIVEFVSEFQSHSWHLAYQGKALAEYIGNSDLEEWDVAVPQGPKTNICIDIEGGNNTMLSIYTESRAISEEDDMLKVSGSKVRVGQGCSTKIGLSKENIEQAKSQLRGNQIATDSTFLNIKRPPILMIHVLSTHKLKDATQELKKTPNILFAIGIGFPGNKNSTKTATYIVNVNEYKALAGLDEEIES